MTDPTTRPARRILAVVTIMRIGDRYAADVVTAHGSTYEYAPTRDEAMCRASSIMATMLDADEEADRA